MHSYIYVQDTKGDSFSIVIGLPFCSFVYQVSLISVSLEAKLLASYMYMLLQYCNVQNTIGYGHTI